MTPERRRQLWGAGNGPPEHRSRWRLWEMRSDWLPRAVRPPVRDHRFWIVQVLVVLIAFLHLAADSVIGPPFSSFPHFATVSLFLVPVVYAALNFGLAGSMATGAWATVVSLPDLVLVDPPRDRIEDLIQVLVLLVVAIFVGQRVEQERLARCDLEIAQTDLRAYASRILSAQEEERHRIAQEIHDEPLQELIQLARGLDVADGLEPQQASEARAQALATAGNLRRISQGLRPPELDELGLPAAISRLGRQLESRTTATVRFSTTGDARLAPELELGIFRIAQEAVHNVERHAAATRIDLELALHERRVVLEVRDDGVGFELENRKPGRLGLLGMRERAELIGGALTISSQPNRGTRVRLEVLIAGS